MTADVSALTELLPQLAGQLQDLLTRTRHHPALTDTAAGHGDLWLGNVLIEQRRLAGVVDWDAFTLRAVPGTDLVHLITTDQRLRQRLSLGAVAATEPWHREPLISLLAHVVADAADPATRRVIGTAWWLNQAATAVRRVPALGEDPDWLNANVRQPLDALSAKLG